MGCHPAILCMVREISNGRQVVKLYHSVNRGKAMYQLAYYIGGRRVQKNFADKAEAKRVAQETIKAETYLQSNDTQIKGNLAVFRGFAKRFYPDVPSGLSVVN